MKAVEHKLQQRNIFICVKERTLPHPWSVRIHVLGQLFLDLSMKQLETGFKKEGKKVKAVFLDIIFCVEAKINK